MLLEKATLYNTYPTQDEKLLTKRALRNSTFSNLLAQSRILQWPLLSHHKMLINFVVDKVMHFTFSLLILLQYSQTHV